MINSPCGCYYGKKCTKTTVCTAESIIEDSVESLNRYIDGIEDGIESLPRVHMNLPLGGWTEVVLWEDIRKLISIIPRPNLTD